MPEPQSPAEALRLVLFGMPDAGKSSLLGALAQASLTQEHLLNGHLADPTRGLAELRRRLYEEGRPRQTLEEVFAYPVTLDPFAAAPARDKPAPIPVQLVDCDGRVANELLARRRALGGAGGSLAGTLLAADALLLVIDASANPAQVDANFTEFGHFLRHFEQSRGARSDVGGLPVFLVLSKCDLLARAGDDSAAWMEHIEERKRQVGLRFEEFLLRDAEGVPLPFGRIDLHLWATAVKRPALRDQPAKPQEPYGVAELFRQGVEYAGAFHRRRARAGRLLAGTVAGVSGLLVALAGLVTALAVYNPAGPPASANPLLPQVNRFRALETPETTSERLRESRLRRRLGQLLDIQGDPRFATLPAEEQEYVLGRLRELRAYQAYAEKIPDQPAVVGATSTAELDQLEARLKALGPPAAYQADWGQTEAVRRRETRLAEVAAFRKAVAQVEDWYRQRVRRGEELSTFSEHRARDGGPIPWRDWHTRANELLEESARSRFASGRELPEAPTLTYAAVNRFPRVAEARAAWESVRQRLERIRDLSAALGLGGTSPTRPAPLDIPPGITLEQARARLTELEQVYPRYAQEFTPAGLPDAVLGEIQAAARTSYQRLLEPGRAAVLRHLQEVDTDGKETHDDWRALRRTWLTSPDELQAWRALATVLARLTDPDKGDPVTTLDAFLRQDRFDLEPRRVVLDVPDELKVRPSGNLTVYLQAEGAAPASLTLGVTGEGQGDLLRRVTRYTFVAQGASALAYRPGDTLWAELPLKDMQNQDLLFTWARSRSQVYQFERLTQPPRLHRQGEDNTQGVLAEGVAATYAPDRALPAVPDLIPVVRLEKR